MSLYCSACEQHLNRYHFSKTQSRKSGRSRRCKNCIEEGNWSDVSSVSSYNSYSSNTSRRSRPSNNHYSSRGWMRSSPRNRNNQYRHDLIINEDEEFYPSSNIDEDENVRLCKFWNGSPGSCRYGRNCRFRHAEKKKRYNNNNNTSKKKQEKVKLKLCPNS